MKRLIIAMMLGAAGCSTLRTSDSVRLQGAWQGQEIGGKVNGVCRIVVSADNAEYWSADTNEWYKATFTLREDTNPKQITCLTTASPYTPMIGKPRYGIYRIEGRTIRLAINEVDNPTVPTRFDAPGARQFEFRKDEK
jgi:uncharacterized protein (TIGR03067 family)